MAITGDKLPEEVAAEIPAGGRHDLRHDLSPDAPEIEDYREGEGAFGYAHSYETGSHLDGPGFRCAASTATIPTPGASSTARASRSSAWSDGSGISRRHCAPCRGD
jgi:hypothetical protein